MTTIDRVTITGADDTTNPADLIVMSEQYPWVEWGLLFGAGVLPGSAIGDGARRFPSHEWTRNLIAMARANRVRLNLSYHLCGEYMREACLGGDLVSMGMIDLGMWNAAQRVQLNFHAIAQRVDVETMVGMMERGGKDWILQLDGVNNDRFEALRLRYDRAVPLFDLSGGAGIVPKDWPKAFPQVYCGYAGGLGPLNLQAEIERIKPQASGETIWLDMETRVRDDADRTLDIARVTEALDVCSMHIQP